MEKLKVYLLPIYKEEGRDRLEDPLATFKAQVLNKCCPAHWEYKFHDNENEPIRFHHAKGLADQSHYTPSHPPFALLLT